MSYKVLYGDTDGIFTKLHTNVPTEGNIVESVAQKALQRIALRRGATFPVDVKYEHFCKRIIFVPKITKRHGVIVAAKKSYAYIDENDNLFVVGLAPRRSSTAALSRELMIQWLELILIKKDVNGAIKLINDAWQNLPKHPANKIGLPRGLHKAKYKHRNPWLVGCQFMTEHYKKVFREDKKPLLIWMKGPKEKDIEPRNGSLSRMITCDTDVICITEGDTEIPKELRIHVNWKRMRKLVITNRFKPLFDAIGISWDVVVTRTKQVRF